jgi:hypothetical protein
VLCPIQAAVGIVGNMLAGEEARLNALEALSYLLEPIDNANGASYDVIPHGVCLLCSVTCAVENSGCCVL